MSIEKINQAAGAMNALTARMNGFVNDADVQIAQRRAAYDGLANNLKNVVNNQMYFLGYVYPDEPNPTLIDGGTFNTIKQCIEAAPSGSYVYVRLETDKIHHVSGGIAVLNRNVQISSFGGGERPIIDFGVSSEGTYNSMGHFAPDMGGSVRFSYAELRLPTVKADDALPWSATRTAVLYRTAAVVVVGIDSCVVVGGEATGLVSCNGASTALVSAYNSQLSGNVFLITAKVSGAAVISKQSLTLSDGALLYSTDGIVGENVIQN